MADDERPGPAEGQSPAPLRRTAPPGGPLDEAGDTATDAVLARSLAGGGRRWGVLFGGVAGAAGIVALGFVGSRLLGLLRTVAIADAFGTDPELDAWWVAFRLPDLVFQVLAGATLSAAFIPTFARVVVREGDEAGWRLASNVLNIVAIATLALATLAFVFAPVLVPALAPGLGAESGRQDELRALAIDLTRIMLLSPIFFGISGMLTGILNARQHFIAPAVAPMIYNASIIVGAVALSGRWGVHGLAAAVVVGSAGHLLVQVPALRRAGMRWRPALGLRSPAVWDVAKLMGPRVIGLAAAQINFLVVIFFASFVSDAAISAINYAFLMMMLPVGIVGMAISTAVFPTLARHAAEGDTRRLRGSVSQTLRLILFLAVPASAGLILLAEPLVRVVLQRGAFGPDSTALVAGALVLYGLGVFAHSGVEILSRGFYALSNTRTPVQTAVLAMLVNVALCAALVGPLGIRGLALAASIAATVEFGVLLSLLRRRIGGFDGAGLRGPALRTLLATALMAALIVATRFALDAAGIGIEGLGEAMVVLVAAGGLGLLAFLAASAMLQREQYELLVSRLRG